MYSELLGFVKKAKEYQNSGLPFWDDEHISKKMLEAHLNPNQEAASRTFEFMDRSVEWIAQIAPPSEYARILDLGCGPGLYAQRFYGKGYDVTGIDISRRSIQYAKESAKSAGQNIRYCLGNYCKIEIGDTFDLVTLIYCDYGALCPEERQTVLRQAYACLRPGGRMILDVFSRAYEKKFKPYQSWWHCPEGGFWHEGAHIVLEEGFLCPNHVLGRKIAVITSGENAMYYLWDTCYSQECLKEEIELVGFSVIGIYGTVAGTNCTDDSDTLAVVVEKPGKG